MEQTSCVCIPLMNVQSQVAHIWYIETCHVSVEYEQSGEVTVRKKPQNINILGCADIRENAKAPIEWLSNLNTFFETMIVKAIRIKKIYL